MSCLATNSFNQTRMELKRGSWVITDSEAESFNQTRMELKLIKPSCFLFVVIRLLIRPEWN